MNGPNRPGFRRLSLPLAALGGGLQTLAWPWPGWWPLAFVSLVPLALATYGQTGPRALVCGWVYGLVLSLTSLPWLADVLAVYGGLGFGLGWLILILLAAYLALYPALFAWLINMRAPGPWNRNLWCWSLAGAGAWAGLDWLKNWVLTGFNWTPLAGPLALSAEFGQAADIFGFYGLGFFVALVNLWLAAALFQRGRAGRPFILAALGLVVLAFGYGRLSHEHWEAAADRAESRLVTVIQPAIEQAEKWEPQDRARHLALYSRLAREAGRTAPWLLLWPETALPFIYDADQEETDWLNSLAAELGGLALLGVSGLDGDWPEQTIHNRMLLFRDGRPGPWYDKRHLVPFGEYLPPFLNLDFMGDIIGAAGIYDPGRPHPPLDLPLDLPIDRGEGRQIRLGLLICFESTFPYLGRERVREGADLLVVPTNDGWFGRSRAPVQHLLQAVMRAIETRRPLVRAGNTGISAVVRPSGRVSQATELMAVGVFPLRTPILAPADTQETLFLRLGYGLAPALAVWTVLMAGLKLSVFRVARPGGTLAVQC